MEINFENLQSACKFYKQNSGLCMNGKNFCASCAKENCPLLHVGLETVYNTMIKVKQ